MFTTKEHLERKTGKFGIDRLHYLQSLVTEFQSTNNMEAKQQILANLANFSYDPINFDFLNQLNVIDLYFDCLQEEDILLIQYSISGVCNLIADPEIRKSILKFDENLNLIVNCLLSFDNETVISALTTLFYISTDNSNILKNSNLLQCQLKLLRTSEQKRISNLAELLNKNINTNISSE